MGNYGNLDVSSWTPGFVSSNPSECVRVLCLLNSAVEELIQEQNYADAVTGLKKISLGLIKLENAGLCNCDKQSILLALLMPTVAILGLLDLNAPEHQLRNAALEYAVGMAEDPDHELSACYPIAKDTVWSYIADLRSGAPLAQILRKYHFPADVFDALDSLGTGLSNLSLSPAFSPPPPSAGSSYSYAPPKTYSQPASYSPPPKRSKSRSFPIGWVLLLVAVAVGVFVFFARPNSIEGLRSPSDEIQQTDPPAQETPDLTDPAREGFIFPDSGIQPIDPLEAQALSDRELTYAINELYARHGYLFKSTELLEYYQQFSWYVGEIPSNEFSVDYFNQIELENWNLLVSERNSRKASG